jgi:membrane protein implicated in regulation of membrane protease activity
MAVSPTVIWLVIGVALCTVELVLPTAFVAAVMGISAFIVAAIATFLPLGVQVLIWMGLSLFLALVSRRFVRYSRSSAILDATEAETLTAIQPGKPGRVLYEGNPWLARCGDEELTIEPKQKVLVVARRGTTLIVMPESLLHLPDVN